MAYSGSIIWNGNPANPIGLAPLGLFDDDDAYVTEAPKIATWVCTRLGYPTMDVELSDAQLYTCFEEAITEYSSQVNEFNMRENLFSIQGSSTSQSITQRLVKGSPLPYIVELSQQYGTEAGVGGNVNIKKGYIDCTAGTQDYDLQDLWANVSESGNRIEIRRVFHERVPASARLGFGYGGEYGENALQASAQLLGEFGWAGYDGGLNYGYTQFMLMPVYDTLLRYQEIEFTDTLRRSQYSFEITNNKIKIIPTPYTGERVWFQYLVTKDKTNGAVDMTSPDGSVVSDYSNAPYTNMMYSNINDVGKRWIRKYTLALAKESLGRILSKYESLPSPNDAQSIRLDGPTLRKEADNEKDTLWDQLRETLLETGRAKQLEKSQANEENAQSIKNKVPLLIYIG